MQRSRAHKRTESSRTYAMIAGTQLECVCALKRELSHPSAPPASPVSKQPANGYQDFGAFGVQRGYLVEDLLRGAVRNLFAAVRVVHRQVERVGVNAGDVTVAFVIKARWLSTM